MRGTILLLAATLLAFPANASEASEADAACRFASADEGVVATPGPGWGQTKVVVPVAGEWGMLLHLTYRAGPGPTGTRDAERNAVTVAFDHADGERWATAFMVLPGQVGAAAGPAAVDDAASAAATGCATVTVTASGFLLAGEHTVTVLGTSDAGGNVALRLPSTLPPSAPVRTGTGQVVTESTLACDTRARAVALGPGATLLEGCRAAFDAVHTPYWFITRSARQDADHDLRWTQAAEGPREVEDHAYSAYGRSLARVVTGSHFQYGELGTGAPGEARVLEVPRYHAASGDENGIMALFVDIPADGAP